MPRHHYGAEAMRWFLEFVLEAATSLRAAARVLELLAGRLPGVNCGPAANAGQWWLLRLGLHELRRPKEKASDWVWLVDHTIQLGQVKCLLIVAVRLSTWESHGCGVLGHKDLTVLALEPMRESTGPRVQSHFEKAARQTGTPRAILSDGGKDLKKAVSAFRESHPAVAELADIKHKLACWVKAELTADARWSAFVAALGRTKSQTQQTELAHLMPPRIKEKSRYMNLGEWVSWARRTLRCLDDASASLGPREASVRLNAKLGWLREYREALDEWNDMLAVVQASLATIRQDGYCRGAAQVLQGRLSPLRKNAMSRRVANQALTFVAEQSSAAIGNEHLPGSTECLESLIGKGKRLEGQQSRNGFTKMILGMAASVATPSVEHLTTALTQTKTRHVVQWCKDKLGTSLQSQRRQALPPLPNGIKTG